MPTKLNDKLKENGILYSGNVRHYSEWNLGSPKIQDGKPEQSYDTAQFLQKTTHNPLSVCWKIFLHVIRMR